MTHRYRTNASIGLLTWLIVILFSTLSQIANGQINHRRRSLPDERHPRSFGYLASLSTQTYFLESDIPELKNLKVTFEGAQAGVLLGNRIGSLKATLGLYYSSASCGRSIDILESTFSGNLYFMKLGGASHRFEPYAITGVKGMRSSYYGNYMEPMTNKNMSTTEEKLIGRVITVQGIAGLGVEFKIIRSPFDFVNMFAEIGCGLSVLHKTSHEAFQTTRASAPIFASIGATFGRIKGL